MSAPPDARTFSTIDPGRWEHLSRHLDQVLELPQIEWSAYIARLERDDPLTATALGRLLESRRDRRFAAFLGEASPLAAPGPAAFALKDKRIGPYVIEAQIGSGGMGSVWKARRDDGRFEGHVAIKLLHLSWLGRIGEQRFQLEGRLLARLDHPNIARLIDAGVLEGGQPYLVLEYIEGEAIDLYCERAKLDVEARTDLFQDVLAAVAHAHRNLIVHRDLKPSNVLVTREGTVKLLDFGIAKLLDFGAETAPTQTLLHGLTPQFAAPEQLLGQAVTTQTDVHALGLMLYVMLTGRHPFESAVQAAARGRAPELVHAVLTAAPPRASLSAAGAPARARALRGDLDNILAKALEKQPAERYGSVGAFADDLRRYRASEPVHARPYTAGYRMRKFVRRHLTGVAAALTVAAALVGATIFASVQTLEARAQRDHALFEAQRAQAQADLVQFVIGDSLSNIPGDTVRTRLDRARRFIASRYRQSPLIAAQLLIDVSGLYIDIGQDRTAAEVIRDVEAINSRVHDPDLTANLACLRAEDLALANGLADAKRHLAVGLASLARMRTVRPQTTAECADATALVLQADGNYAQAVARLSAARRTLVQAGMYGASRYTSTTNNLARAMLLEGDYRSAWTVQRDLITLMRALGRDNTSSWWPMLSNACRALLGGGQPRRATELLDRALADAHRENPKFEPPYTIAGCLAAARMTAGEAEAADADLLRATRAAKAAGALAAFKFYPAMTVVAAIERRDLDAADARWATLQPYENRALAAGARDAEAVRVLVTHARLDLAHGRTADASMRLRKAESLIAARRQPINPDAYDIAVLMARASLQMGVPADAERHAEQALALAKVASVDAGSSALVGEALLWRARAERALGKSALATASARDSESHLQANLLPGHPLIAAARDLASEAATANRETRRAPASASR